MSRSTYSYGSLALVSAIVILFQCCSRAQLMRPALAEIASVATGKVDLCLDSGYTIETAHVTNVNLVRALKGAALDSDGDGIADHIETAAGFDPHSRRSNGILQDKICWILSGGSTDCLSTLPSCNSTLRNPLGFTDCDVRALGLDLVNSHPTQGLDTDKDGMLDWLELRNNTAVVEFDSTADPDHDGLLNQDELQAALNPIYFDTDAAADSRVLWSIAKVATSSCAGEFWSLDIAQVPLSPVPSFSESALPGAFDYSHQGDENILTVMLKIKPKPGVNGNSRVYFYTHRLNIEKPDPIYATFSQFSLAGEVLP